MTCPETLPWDYEKTGDNWLLMAKEWASIYHNCAVPHNGLVEFINSQ